MRTIFVRGACQNPKLEWTREFLERAHNEPYDMVGVITKEVRMEVLDFEGRLDPTIFSNWLASIEYFDWYDMIDERRLTFTKTKLVGLAKVWWSGVEGDNRKSGQPLLSTWQEIKAKLPKKYMPADYYD